MSFFGQSQSIPGDEPQPVEEEDPLAGRLDRRRRMRFGHEGRKILVIDNSAMVVAMLGDILHSAGCVVLDAGDAETGLSIACEETPDLIFLDIVLPGMSGFAALRRMRRDPRTQRIPVIIISGAEQAVGRSYAKRIGADDFMKKPFSRRGLFTHIEMLIVEDAETRRDGSAILQPRAVFCGDQAWRQGGRQAVRHWTGGQSPKMSIRPRFRQIERFSPSQSK
jgi:twitching motility two-component system response regulator PilH